MIVISYDSLPESQCKRNFNRLQILQQTGKFKTALGLVEIFSVVRIPVVFPADCPTKVKSFVESLGFCDCSLLFTNLLHYEKKFAKLM